MFCLSKVPFFPASWNVSSSPVRVLGDNIEGPHSTAIIVGSKTILACQHSLSFVSATLRNTFNYNEYYWIQPSVSKTSPTTFSHTDRVELILFKYNVENDWAILQRTDGLEFPPADIATIELSISEDNLFKDAKVLHCPISLLNSNSKGNEFPINCNLSAVHIQAQSSHHLKYEGRDLVRGSSGGAVFINPSNKLVGMHIEAISENEYDTSTSEGKVIHGKKRVESEDNNIYAAFQLPPTKKTKLSDSEAIASVAGGNNGLGSCLIICKFERLMHYINECETAVI